MTIGRVTSNVDLYSHLRLDVYAHGPTSGRQAPPNSENSNAVARHSRQNSGLNLELEDRQRPRRWEADDDGKLVPFERPATELAESRSEARGTAQEIPILLEVDRASDDPLLAQAALLYKRSGRSARVASFSMIGTQLDAVA